MDEEKTIIESGLEKRKWLTEFRFQDLTPKSSFEFRFQGLTSLCNGIQ
ncbi:MAG: hypothetical protein KAS70_03665 [Planctomycetes bacterium]|nr:hypothetical protein [Planctomycetota bacterium]